MAKPKNDWAAIKPFKVWNNGSTPVGIQMKYAGYRWISTNWDNKRRAMTLVSLDGSMSVTIFNPYCMQWEK